jgi:hypothetical protein
MLFLRYRWAGFRTKVYFFVGFSSILATVFSLSGCFFAQAEKLRLRITMATKTQGM